MRKRNVVDNIIELKAMADSRLIELGQWFDEQKIAPGNLIWVPMKQFDIELYSQGVQNQLIVLYQTGRYQVLPRKVTGSFARSFLGLNFTSVYKWSILWREKNHRQTNPTFQNEYDFYARYCSGLLQK